MNKKINIVLTAGVELLNKAAAVVFLVQAKSCFPSTKISSRERRGDGQKDPETKRAKRDSERQRETERRKTKPETQDTETQRMETQDTETQEK